MRDSCVLAMSLRCSHSGRIHLLEDDLLPTCFRPPLRLLIARSIMRIYVWKIGSTDNIAYQLPPSRTNRLEWHIPHQISSVQFILHRGQSYLTSQAILGGALSISVYASVYAGL